MSGRPPQLTVAAVRYLRAWRAERLSTGRRVGPSYKQLANRYNMTVDAIWKAAAGMTYKWVQ